MNSEIIKMVVIPLVLLILEFTSTAKAFPFVKDRDTTEITDNRLLTDFSDSTVSLAFHCFKFHMNFIDLTMFSLSGPVSIGVIMFFFCNKA